MKKLHLLFITLLFNGILFANPSSNWMRYASISPNGEQIAFTYKGDIYLVAANGGEAKALTFHEAHDFMPVWNNDGSKIAFASDRYGNFDIFVIEAKGGQAKRLSFHSADEYPYTFSHDNEQIIFGAARLDDVNHRQYPTASQPEVYTVNANGGGVKQLWTIPAEDIQVSKNGQQYIYHDKKGGENTFRKHHTSSITRDIWTYDVATKEHKMIITFKGEDRNPIYSPDEKSVYYLSEKSGCFNVHEMSFSQLNQDNQITNFEKHPVRYLSMSDRGLLCYTQNGDIYTQQIGKENKKIDITISTEDKSNNEQIVKVSGSVNEMAVSPDGKEVAYIVRGEIFVSSVDGKMTKRITNTPAQEKFVSFSPDGKKLLYASEREAKWSIYQSTKVFDTEPYFFASTLLKEESIIENPNDNYEPKFSPNGEEIAFIENRNTLRIFNLASKQTRTLMGSDKLYYMQDGDQGFEWSPDSKWLFVEYSPVMANSEVVLIAADGTQKMINLSESGYGDFNPKWVNGGKQMLWFSDRHGLKSYANSGSRQLDVYTLFFTKDTWDQFNMTKDEYALWKEINKPDKKEADKSDKKKKEKDKKAKPKTEDIKFDWNGLNERKKRLTIHSSNLRDAVLSKDGEDLYYLSRFEKDLDLWTTNIRTKETKMLIKLGAKSGSLEWDQEMKKLFLLSDGKISTLDLKAKKKTPVSIQGEIMLDVAAERQQMFDHVWKRTESMFYISGFHGAPWKELKENYEAKLPSIANDLEFSELLSEMLGELNTSHTGARYRSSSPDGDQTASLGLFIDYNYQGEGLKIAELIKDGPLDKDHLKVKKGMIIKSINGEIIKSNIDYAKYLNRLAGDFTALSVLDPETNNTQNITIKPISLREESTLLYNRWVRINEEEVNRLSNGTLAYVHIRGMNDGQYRNTYEKVMGKYLDREALIADVRFNGGGDLVGDLAMFFTGERFIDYAIEDRTVGYEPGYRWNKPSLAMINEADYSDGSCFACGYQDLGIGKLVGMPVPGTCSFAGWEMLQNGKVLWGSVPVSAKNKAGEWMENNETIPEIMVKNRPGIIDNGRDQQLEAAIKELMESKK